MKRKAKLFEIFFLGSILYAARLAGNVFAMLVTSAIAAPFVMAAFSLISWQSDGAVPALGYFASLGVSFILVFTSQVGARGAAQSKA